MTPAPTIRKAIILIKMIHILQVGGRVTKFIQADMVLKFIVLKFIVLIGKNIKFSHNF